MRTPLMFVALLCAAMRCLASEPQRECLVVHALDASLDYVSDAEECATASSPHSTFKLPHALIALQTGVVADPLALVPWDGSRQNFPSWEQAHSLDSALKWSAVWFFVRTAGLIGRDRMVAGLRALDYAQDSYDGDQTAFWRNGDLLVSPIEQRLFLQRLLRAELPVDDHNVASVKAASLMSPGTITMGQGEVDFGLRWPGLRALHAKTGNGIAQGEATSWLVGWFETDETTYVFASRVRAQEPLPLTAGIELALRGLNTLGRE